MTERRIALALILASAAAMFALARWSVEWIAATTVLL